MDLALNNIHWLICYKTKPNLFPLEDISIKLNEGTCMAKIDLSDAFLQIEVEDSKEFLTINTHEGFFRNSRLTYDVKSTLAFSCW